MIVLQAFPMSFSIFWRLVMVFPVLLIGLVLYGLIGGIIGLIAGFLFPFAAAAVSFMLSASSSVIPALVGTRMGLQSLHVRPGNGINGLIVPALIYGVVEGLGALLIVVLSLGTVVITTSADLVSLAADAAGLERFADLALMIPGLVAVMASLLGICAIRACLLVPITSASIGRDPDGIPYTPFRHIGAAFGPLFGLVLLGYVIMFLLFLAIVVGALASGAIETLAASIEEVEDMMNGRAPIRPPWSLIIVVAAYLLVALWSFSLQCAGGVLGYLQLRNNKGFVAPNAQDMDAQPARPVAKSTGPRMSAEDLRALRKSRQSGRS